MATIAVNDLIILKDAPPARVEYVETDVQVVNAYGDRWQVPVEFFRPIAPAVRGGGPALWAISPTWTA